MPNPKLETYKNKATGTVYDYTDAAAQAALAGILDGTDINNFSDVESALATKVDKVTGKGLSTNDYDNTAKGIVDNIQSNVIANTKLIKDTVGWSGKNKWNVKDSSIAYDASSGLIYTVLEKGYQVTNSTAAEWASLKMITASNLKANTDYKLSTDITITSGTARIIVSGATSQGGTYTNIVDSQNITSNGRKEITFNTENYTWFRVTIYSTVGTSTTGNVKYDDFMIMDADILDDTYEPYFGSTAFPRSEQAVLGAKNRLPFVTPNNTDLNGVTYSYDENGLKLNGTVNVDTYFNYTVAKFSDMPDIVGKTITISLEGNQSNDFMFLQIHHYDGISQKAVYVNGNELTLTVTEAALSDSNSGLYLQIPAGHSGYQFNNFVVKPMIRDSADPDPTYAPFAMTNKELTDAVVLKDITSDITRNTEQTAYSVSTLFVYKIGRLITVIGDITSLTENAVPTGRSFTIIATGLPKALKNSNMFTMPIGSGNQTQIYVEGSTGNFKMRGGTNNQTYQFVFTYISES